MLSLCRKQWKYSYSVFYCFKLPPLRNQLNKQCRTVMRGSSALDRVALFLEERLENHLLMSFCRAIRLSCGVGESSLPPPSPHLTSSPSSQRSRVCLGLRNVPPPFLKHQVDHVSSDPSQCTRLAALTPCCSFTVKV